MNLLKINSTIVSEVIEISKLAGKAIMDIYSTDFDYKIKSDNSPLTKADLESNQLIVRELKKLNPLIPVLSEEESDVSLEKRMSWEQYWLIDPLDGTKEFLNSNSIVAKIAFLVLVLLGFVVLLRLSLFFIL